MKNIHQMNSVEIQHTIHHQQSLLERAAWWIRLLSHQPGWPHKDITPDQMKLQDFLKQLDHQVGYKLDIVRVKHGE